VDVGEATVDRRTRRKFLQGSLALAGLGLVWGCGFAPPQPQQPARIPRVGILSAGPPEAVHPIFVEPFLEGLRELGYVEGRDVALEQRWAEREDQFADLAAELVGLGADVLLTRGIPAALGARQATATLPIVAAAVSDPVGTGLVASLARPGGNVAGNANLSPERLTKRLEVLKDALPKLGRVGVLRQSRGVLGDLQLGELRSVAVALTLKLEEIETQPDATGLESAFQTAKQKQVGAIITTTATTFFAERKRIVELAGKYRLPVIYPQKEYVDVGGLMSYGADSVDLYRRAAVYVDKILKGAKPADLPVQQATKFEFVVNLKAAKQIGLTIPVRVLEQSNQIIK
jgi:putative ABC transport system substrate-binding protein